MIHLVETETRPEDGEIVRTKCNKELVFRPFSLSLDKMTKICAGCDSGRPTKIPNFLSVLEIPLSKNAMV